MLLHCFDSILFPILSLFFLFVFVTFIYSLSLASSFLSIYINSSLSITLYYIYYALLQFYVPLFLSLSLI